MICSPASSRPSIGPTLHMADNQSVLGLIEKMSKTVLVLQFSQTTNDGIDRLGLPGAPKGVKVSYIYKIVHGKNVMRIQKGRPIRHSGSVLCTNGAAIMTYSVQTRNKRRCTISTYC